MTDWASHTVVDLRAECKKRDLPIKGLKAELVARLQEADKSQQNGTPIASVDAAPVPPTPLGKTCRSTDNAAQGKNISATATPARKGSRSNIMESEQTGQATPTRRSSRASIAATPAAEATNASATPVRRGSRLASKAADEDSATRLATTTSAKAPAHRESRTDGVAPSTIDRMSDRLPRSASFDDSENQVTSNASNPDASNNDKNVSTEVEDARSTQPQPTGLHSASPADGNNTDLFAEVDVFSSRTNEKPPNHLDTAEKMDVDTNDESVTLKQPANNRDDPLPSTKRKHDEGDHSGPQTPAKKAKAAEEAVSAPTTASKTISSQIKASKLALPAENIQKAENTEVASDASVAQKPVELSILGAAARGAGGIAQEPRYPAAVPTVAERPVPAPLVVEGTRTVSDQTLMSADSNACLLTAASTASFANQDVGEPGTTVWIKNFTRPLTLPAVKELLSPFGTLEKFWMDKIKSNCYVTYDTVDGATAAIQNCHGLKFPVETGRQLVCEFVTREQADEAIAATKALTARPFTPALRSSFRDDHFMASVSSAGRMSAGFTPPPAATPGRLVQPSVVAQQERVYAPPPLPRDAIPSETAFKKTKTHPPIFYRPRTEVEVQQAREQRDHVQRPASRSAPAPAARDNDGKEDQLRPHNLKTPNDTRKSGTAIHAGTGGM
ncbi:hypothetical protein HDU87_000973 [Geranomyces variabilis]|uniref:SAP domain-containing protein n=1 Tax=Geranomyces variabilis TaxID=109894 RepID=A0AAD5TBH5_9FUNG|nr:hypothetical protein HDU87_000973 [Geranomyces variabilis]